MDSSLLGFVQKKYSVVDRAIAEALQEQENLYGLSSDEEIARQLQDMENLFITSIPDESTHINIPHTDVIPIEPVPISGDSPNMSPSHEVQEHDHLVIQDPIDPDNMTYEELEELAEDIGSESKGLSEETIASLPVSKVKNGFFSNSKKKSDCAICQSAIGINDIIMTLPCKHGFHKDCITPWLKLNKVCPMCKYEIQEKNQE